MNWKDIFPAENRFFETENGILYCADSKELLPKFPSESIDLIITDPPYFISVKNKAIRSKVFDCNYILDFGPWDRQWRSQEEHLEWLGEITRELTRILKPNSWFYMWNSKTNVSFLTLFDKDFGLKTKTWIIWVKENAIPNILGVNYSNVTDVCYVAVKGIGKLINRPKKRADMRNVYFGANSSAWPRDLRGHPTAKPVELSQRMIYFTSREGDLVLDAFGGGGNILYAAQSLNRRWIGIERNPEYCNIIKSKLSRIDSVLDLDFLTPPENQFEGELIDFESEFEEGDYE